MSATATDTAIDTERDWPRSSDRDEYQERVASDLVGALTERGW